MTKLFSPSCCFNCCKVLVPLQCNQHVKSNPCCCCCCCVASVVFDSVRPHRRQPTRLLCPWDSPGKNTGVGCHFLLHPILKKQITAYKLHFLITQEFNYCFHFFMFIFIYLFWLLQVLVAAVGIFDLSCSWDL